MTGAGWEIPVPQPLTGWWPTYYRDFALNVAPSIQMGAGLVEVGSLAMSVPSQLAMAGAGRSAASFGLNMPASISMAGPPPLSADFTVPASIAMGLSAGERYARTFGLAVPAAPKFGYAVIPKATFGLKVPATVIFGSTRDVWYPPTPATVQSGSSATNMFLLINNVVPWFRPGIDFVDVVCVSGGGGGAGAGIGNSAGGIGGTTGLQLPGMVNVVAGGAGGGPTNTSRGQVGSPAGGPGSTTTGVTMTGTGQFSYQGVVYQAGVGGSTWPGSGGTAANAQNSGGYGANIAVATGQPNITTVNAGTIGAGGNGGGGLGGSGAAGARGCIWLTFRWNNAVAPDLGTHQANVQYFQSSTGPQNQPATYQYMNNNSANGSINGGQTGTAGTGEGEWIMADLGTNNVKNIRRIVIGYDYMSNLPGGWGLANPLLNYTHYPYNAQIMVCADSVGWPSYWDFVGYVPASASLAVNKGLVSIAIDRPARCILISSATGSHGRLALTEFQVWAD